MKTSTGLFPCQSQDNTDDNKMNKVDDQTQPEKQIPEKGITQLTTGILSHLLMILNSTMNELEKRCIIIYGT